MFYDRSLEELDRRKVKYLTVGGFAVNLYGYDRITGDLDIVLLMTKGNIQKFIQVVQQFNLKSRVPVALEDFAVTKLRKLWIKEKNMKAFSLYNPQDDTEHVDVVIDYPVRFQEAYKRREQMESFGVKISLMSLNDLIKMKKFAGRQRDIIDIKALMFIKGLKNGSQKKDS